MVSKTYALTKSGLDLVVDLCTLRNNCRDVSPERVKDKKQQSWIESEVYFMRPEDVCCNVHETCHIIQTRSFYFIFFI